MADIYGKIAEKLNAIAKKGKMSDVLILPAQVKSVDGTTCAVSIDDLEITGVRLRAVINSEKEQLLITPKIGSYVLIADLSGGNFTDFAVISYSEVEAISIKIDSQTINIDKDGIVCNGGNLGGMIKIQELTNKLNELVNAFNTHTHTVATSGTASSQTGMAAPIAAQTQTFSQSDYEDVKLKH